MRLRLAGLGLCSYDVGFETLRGKVVVYLRAIPHRFMEITEKRILYVLPHNGLSILESQGP